MQTLFVWLLRLKVGTSLKLVFPKVFSTLVYSASILLTSSIHSASLLTSSTHWTFSKQQLPLPLETFQHTGWSPWELVYLTGNILFTLCNCHLSGKAILVSHGAHYFWKEEECTKILLDFFTPHHPTWESGPR